MFESSENLTAQSSLPTSESPEKQPVAKEEKEFKLVRRPKESDESWARRQAETPEEREARRQRARELDLQQQEEALIRKAAKQAKKLVAEPPISATKVKQEKKNVSTLPVSVEQPPQLIRYNDETDEEWEIRQQQVHMLEAYHQEKQISVDRLNQLRQEQKDKLQSQEIIKNNEDFERLNQRILEIARSVTWEHLPDFLVTNPNPEVHKRTKAILQSIDFKSWVDLFSADGNAKNFDYFGFRGLIFEALVLEELNDGEPNNALGYFVLDCVKNPWKLGLGKDSLKNPDYLGVVIDEDSGEARITGMYEVKVGRTERGQLNNFYNNLKVVIEKINEKLTQLATHHGISFPKKGITLLPPDEIDKLLVIPLPVTDLEVSKAIDKKNMTKSIGWSLVSSSFSQENIDLIAVFMREHYRSLKNKKQNPNTIKNKKEQPHP